MKYTKPEIEVFLLEQQIMTLETSGYAPEEGGNCAGYRCRWRMGLRERRQRR